jgi:cell division septation protein DedD
MTEVSRQLPITILLFSGVVTALTGCVSSEESGAGNKARMPVQVFGPIDTTRRTASPGAQEGAAKALQDSLKLATMKKGRIAPRFKSRQDTVRASVVVKSKSSLSRRIKIERPEHPVFTIQIGAFGRASNALRAQKKAKARFADQPVFNNYVKSAKLYRVSIGRVEDRQDAFALRDKIKRTFPGEYSQCWINYIP